jgi:hypothetical protein
MRYTPGRSSTFSRTRERRRDRALRRRGGKLGEAGGKTLLIPGIQLRDATLPDGLALTNQE